MFDLKRIRLVAVREIRTAIRKKSFIFSLIAQLVIVALLTMSPVIIARFSDGDDGPTTQKIAVVDATDSNVQESLQTNLQMLGESADTTFDLSPIESEDAARDAVDNDDVDAAVVATREGSDLTFTVITDDGDMQDDLAQMLVAATGSVAMQDRFDRANLSSDQVTQIFSAPNLTMTNTNAGDGENSDDDASNTVNYVIAYASTIVIFIFVMMYGQWISQGVVEEKASRIMEIMLNAATPRDLLAGKVIGIMVTALMQFVPLVLTVGIIASLQTQIGALFGVEADQLLDINLGSVAWSAMGWFLLYFILGFLLFGALYAGVGSMVSRQEEVSTAVAPMTTIMMVGYFAALMSMSNPDGMIARVAYLFPGTSVFVAMLRLVNGNPESWEIAVSIIGLIVAIVLAMLLAARLYKVGVLMYGQTPGLKSLLRLKGMQQVAR